MIVLDANVWLTALTDQSEIGQRCRAAMAADKDYLVPCHGPIEVLRALGKLELAGALTAEQANHLSEVVCGTALQQVMVDPDVLRFVWFAHHNISAYDAPYVAIALRYGVPLLTRDKRLARAAAMHGVAIRSGG